MVNLRDGKDTLRDKVWGLFHQHEKDSCDYSSTRTLECEEFPAFPGPVTYQVVFCSRSPRRRRRRRNLKKKNPNHLSCIWPSASTRSSLPVPRRSSISQQEAYMREKAEAARLLEKRRSVSAWPGPRCPSARSTCSKCWSSGSWASARPASSSATCTSSSRSTTGRRSAWTLPSKSSTGTARRWSGCSCGTSQVRGNAGFLRSKQQQ